MSEHTTFRKRSRSIYRLLIVICAIAVIAAIIALYFGNPVEEMQTPITNEAKDSVRADLDAKTGLIRDMGMTEVIANCTSCHSAELVTQNRMTKEGWLSTIRWMQESQNLWNLGTNEEIILDYLAKNYAPEDKGRREPLTDIEWYALKD